MSYSRSHDFPRVCGLALEAADRYRATVGAEFPVAVVLDVGKPGELTVTQDIDPDLPQVLQFANGAKACIDEELRALQATGGASEFGDDSEAAHAVASSKIRDAKRVYRSAFEARKQAQMELVHVDARRKYLFRLLVAKFQAAHDLVST